MDIMESEDAFMMAVQHVLAEGGVDDPQLESERIIMGASELDFADVKGRAMTMAQTRASGVPLGYVLGRQRFMGIELSVNPGVLIPRNETELLGWEAVARLREARGVYGLGARVIDMCCGSGNLACGIAYALPGAQVWASDLMEDCAILTARNTQRLGLDDRVHTGFGDLFEPLLMMGASACDAVVCNPPYISSHRLTWDRQDLLNHEPRQAFDGGPYGLSIYQRLIHDAAPFLVRGGWLLLELGVGQAASLERLLHRCGYYDRIELVADPLGEFRVVAARRM